MVRELIKKIDLDNLVNSSKVKKYFIVAMVSMLVIIAIILIHLNLKRQKVLNEYATMKETNDNVFDVVLCEDKEIINIINQYFDAKTNLNYVKIFELYGRDYYSERNTKSKEGQAEVKRIINVLKYEKVFIKSYENITIYSCAGYKTDDVMCVVTYDMNLGFANANAPMILIFYLEKEKGHYYINNNLDVGMSKYIVDMTKTEKVKKIYEDVVSRLSKLAVSSESFRLVYNTIRQLEINQNIDISDTDIEATIDAYKNINIYQFDPKKEANSIYDSITNEKKEMRAKEKLDEYLNKVIASLSDAQRIR